MEVVRAGDVKRCLFFVYDKHLVKYIPQVFTVTKMLLLVLYDLFIRQWNKIFGSCKKIYILS